MRKVRSNRLYLRCGVLLVVVLLVFTGCPSVAKPTPVPSPVPPSAPATTATPKPPIKIGVLNPLSGPLSTAGEEGNRGIEKYFEDNGWEIGGRKVQLIKEDDEANPKAALEKARKLVEHDKASVLTGIVSSAVAIALRDYVDAQKVPLILGMSGAWDLCFDRKSDYVLNPVHINGDHSYGIAKYAYEKLGYKKAIIMGSDYAAAYDFADVFQGAFEEAGGTGGSKSPDPIRNY